MSALSAVIITRDEAHNIVACLQSVKAVCADVVVVDTGSTDATVALAEEQGAKVESIDWPGYSAAKNFANSLAANDWILSIDADERVSPELAQSLIALQPQAQHVYLLDRFTNYCGHWVRYCGWYPEWKARIFDRRSIQWQGDFVHEALAIPPDYQQERLDGKLYHYSYYTADEHYQRLDRYAQLAAQQMHANGKNISPLRPAVSAAARFLTTYFIKQGWRDGPTGLAISRRAALEVYKKYSGLLRMNRLGKQNSQ